MLIAAATTRRWLHDVHALATVVLLITGFVIQLPELRAALIGGYGQRVIDVHLWTGVASGIAPLLALGLYARALGDELRRRLGPPDPWRWKKSHIVVSLAFTLALFASGVVMWIDDALPRAITDAARFLHIVLTWAIALVLPVHLVVSRRKILERVRVWLGLATAVDELFFDDPDDQPVRDQTDSAS